MNQSPRSVGGHTRWTTHRLRQVFGCRSVDVDVVPLSPTSSSSNLLCNTRIVPFVPISHSLRNVTFLIRLHFCIHLCCYRYIFSSCECSPTLLVYVDFLTTCTDLKNEKSVRRKTKLRECVNNIIEAAKC